MGRLYFLLGPPQDQDAPKSIGGYDAVKLISRLVALILVVPAAYFFIYWFPFSWIPLGEQHWIASAVSLLCAVAAGWFVWVKLNPAPQGATATTLLGAVLLGSLGFAAGFFGPMILAPEANQGPLLGIFITGPLGLVIGGIGGFLYWLSRSRKADKKDAYR